MFKSQGLQCNVNSVTIFHFGTEQLMWLVLKVPEGLDQPRHLLSKQLSQSWTSQLQLRIWDIISKMQ